MVSTSTILTTNMLSVVVVHSSLHGVVQQLDLDNGKLLLPRGPGPDSETECSGGCQGSEVTGSSSVH